MIDAASQVRGSSTQDALRSWLHHRVWQGKGARSFDLEVGHLNTGSNTGSNPCSSFAATYMTPDNATVRRAGRALLFSQPQGDAISQALRVSHGRVMGVSEPVYQFVE